MSSLIPGNQARAVSVTSPEKSRIDLSHYIMGSGQIGVLMPVGWYEIVPGDSLSLQTNIKVEMAPLVRNIYHRLDTYIHHFWVPYRLCMPRIGITNTDFESFIQGDPEASFNNDTLPYFAIDNNCISAGNFEEGMLPDYLGLPIIDNAETTTQDLEINILPFLTYALIYDEYYRNEWLEDRLCGPTGNWTISLEGGDRGADEDDLCSLRTCYYERDLFYGATPDAYKGSDTDVELDLEWPGGEMHLKDASTHNLLAGVPTALNVDASAHLEIAGGNDGYLATNTGAGNVGYTAVLEIMELRRVEALTRFLEAENRLGSDNYGAWLLSVFGVRNPDFRDAYPRYLGGGKIRMDINTITAPLNTYDGGAEDYQGLKTGTGVSSGATDRVRLNATEYGIVMSIMHVVPRTAYKNQVEKFWTVINERTELYNPYFQNIGDEEILEGERGYQLDSSNTDVWGYAPRWYRYKYKQSYVCGDFAVDGYDAFHMAQIHDITGAPDTLSSSNAKVNYADDHNLRIFAVGGTVDHLYYQVFNDAQFVRPMYLVDIPK